MAGMETQRSSATSVRAAGAVAAAALAILLL
jgi:hypothetical protein